MNYINMSVSPKNNWNSCHKSQQSYQMYESIEDHIRKNNHQIISMQNEYNQLKNNSKESMAKKGNDQKNSKKNTYHASKNIISITQRDIIALIDKCSQLMRDDKLFLRERVKNYFKDLTYLKDQDRCSYEGAIDSQYDISELIQIIAQCKKPLDRVHLYEKHWHWLQVKLRKYVGSLHRKKKQNCLEQFRKTKRLVTYQDQNIHKVKSPIPGSTKRDQQNKTSCNFYKRFKHDSSIMNKTDKMRPLSQFSQETSSKNYGKSQITDYRKKYLQNRDSQDKSLSMKSSLRGNKIQKALSRPLSRNQKKSISKQKQFQRYPYTCQNKNSKQTLHGWKSSQNNHKQSKPIKPPIKNKDKNKHKTQYTSMRVKNNDIDELSQINKKSSIIQNQQQNFQSSIMGTMDRINRSKDRVNTCKQQKQIEELDKHPHICSLVQKQSCQVSQWSKKLTTNDYSQTKIPLTNNNCQISSKIQSIQIANKKIDQILASSRKLTDNIQIRDSQLNFSPQNINSYKDCKNENLFTSPQILAQCRKFINYGQQKKNQKQSHVNLFADQVLQQKKWIQPLNYHQNMQIEQAQMSSPKFGSFTFQDKKSNQVSHSSSKKQRIFESVVKYYKLKDIVCQVFRIGLKAVLGDKQINQIADSCNQSTREQFLRIIESTSQLNQSNDVYFEDIVSKILKEYRKNGDELNCVNIFQLLDLDGKQYVQNDDFQVFLQNLKISQVEQFLLSEISSALMKLKAQLDRINLDSNIYRIQSFYYVQVMYPNIFTILCQVLEPFQFEINNTQN